MIATSERVLCPVCNNKTRVQIREDTELKNFPFIVQSADRKVLSESQMQDHSLLTLNFLVAGFSAC